MAMAVNQICVRGVFNWRICFNSLVDSYRYVHVD